jgi:ankyrin repeat protein
VSSKGEYTALNAVRNNNKVSEVELLISNGSNIEARHHSYYSPLHRAVFKNNFEVAEFLLSKGANPNVLGSSNWAMPLTSIINIHKIKLTRLLLEHGADINYRD